MNPLISIIVPVYNVEPYLRKCLDSIISQIYCELEILLIDDGSTDKSGIICDEYSRHDSRIRVIHQPNRGVSAARNAGLAAASGSWIGWVDSDDWIEPEMYKDMMECALQDRADIVVCSRAEHYINDTVKRIWPQKTVLNTEGGLRFLLENDIMQNFLWDKLWRREIFENIVFPEGHTFEDIAVMHRLFVRANQIICLPKIQYHYLQRSGSIVDDKSLENRINHYLAAKLRLEEIGEQWPQLRRLMEAQCVASSITVWCAYYSNPRSERNQFMPQLKEAATFAKRHYQDAQTFMRLGPTGRAVLRLTPYAQWWAFALSSLFGWLYKWKHGRSL